MTGRPTTRVVITLNSTDLGFLRLYLGQHWATTIRALVHEYVTQLRLELEPPQDQNQDRTNDTRD